MKQATFKKLDRPPAYRMLADALSGKIVTGELSAGEPLPTEADLCEAFGVKRTTVREGIRALEAAGLVTREAGGKKLIVTRPSTEHVGNQMQRAMILQEVTNGELCDAMLAIEPALVHAAANIISSDGLAELDANIAATANALKAGHNAADLDVAFHSIIARASGNRALQMARQPLMPLLEPSFHRVIEALPNAGARMLKAHRQIVRALKRRDGNEAENWMARHVRDFRRGFKTAGIGMEQPIKL
ncbi:MAG: FCD domain-containing protein [Pseudomonadota bacterium]